MKRSRDLQFDEFAPDVFSGSGELDYIETPLSGRSFLLVAAVAALVLLILLTRIITLNVVKGDFYTARALANVNREKAIPANRGIITDRYGTVLAKNAETFSLFVNTNDLLRDRQRMESALAQVSQLTQVPLADLLLEIEKADMEATPEIPLVRNIEADVAISLKTLTIPGLHVENDFRREYINAPVFAPVLGYTGLSDTENAVIGKSGLERFYDDQLRGRDGVYTYVRNALGQTLDERLTVEPISGATLETSLDAELQEYFYARLQQQLQTANSSAAVGIAIEPATGEILALASLPSYDNNVFVTPGKNAERAALFADPNKPLFNRAILGAYSPGSTIKPLVALAGLREGVMDPVFGVYSPGYLDIPNPYFPDKPTRFLDWKAHGWVNVRKALAVSSNVYFYVIGGGDSAQSEERARQGLGITRLREYWQQFGFGSATGVDFVDESLGFLPAPEEKEERTGQPWRIGDTYNVSIGQGDLLVSPLQLVRFTASIADDGQSRRPHFARKITDPDGTTTVNRGQEVLFDYSSWELPLEEVQTGMVQAVTEEYGTARMLNTLAMTAAGKTGSAQINNNTAENAFFVGYAPAEDPQIAILVLIETAKSGSLNAVPVAYDVLQWFYENRLQNENSKL
ncbi:MAG: penicillin-binding protein 2 [Candidatus Harrisonbacteria bacterium CG10_big_fil_rev_8_21_14_0_10_49_15]|uniref:Penicillin-binding protein 2 n=1 Tax=Candidatus Harrisonbacteria bacterium CG10_big_fil_rev_8_21_14_0_10_49_15 TaxID=1974587 RepID=A0A2H0ULR9_9BACT|nr:MAG: penicillin-binding protein 2 [Candidatus Harrisonbacteria bacterium CG10_big_fil_rev_8_21_14_0_10_49_15]